MSNIVVVGLGGMGAAALAHLARRGLRPLGIEQFEPGHNRGSSHGWSRVIRQAYFEHPNYVPLLERAFELWDELEAETHAEIVHKCGVLILGAPDSVAIAKSRESAELHGIATSMLAPDELRERFPQFAVPDDYIGLLEPGGGFAIPEHGNAAHLDVARQRGARIERRCVDRIEADGEGVRIHTSDGPILAERVIVTAGAWTGRLVPSLEEFLQPQRKVLAWFDGTTPGDDPAWLIDDGDPGGVYYGTPTWPDQVGPAGVKIGFHGPGPAIEPGVREAAPEDVLARFARDMTRWRPDLRDVVASTTCTYTMSPDEHFIVGPTAGASQIVVGCGFSGHGYKFAPAIGEVLADFAQNTAPGCDTEFLSPRRLSGQGVLSRRK